MRRTNRPSRLRLPAMRATALAAFLLAAGPAWPYPVYWVGPKDGGYWTEGKNWNIHATPVGMESAYLGDANVIVHVYAPLVQSITGSGTLTIQGEYGNLLVERSSSIGGMQLLDGTFRVLADMTVAGESYWGKTTISALDFPGRYQGNFQFNGPLTIGGAAEHNYVGTILTLAGATNWQAGTIRSADQSKLINTGVFTDSNSGDVAIAPTTRAFNASWTNDGTYRKTGSGKTQIDLNFSNSAGGVLSIEGGTLALTGKLSNFADKTLSGGVFGVSGNSVLSWDGADIVTNAASITLDGSNARILNSKDGSDALRNLKTNVSGATLNLLNGANLSTQGRLTNSGTIKVGADSKLLVKTQFDNYPGSVLRLAGGTVQVQAQPGDGNSGEFGLLSTNNSVLTGFGTIRAQMYNSGTVVASGGTLAFEQAFDSWRGSVQVASGATLQLNQGGRTVNLLLNGALNLGGNNLVVSGDYDNSNFGEGNKFNRHAGMVGAGAIVAGTVVRQTATGTGLRNGDGRVAVLDLGNVRVGQSGSGTFAIHNQSSPIYDQIKLRGAIQTMGISDGALSGSGVTAQNWGPIAPGANSASYTVNFSPVRGGVLTGQSLAIVNNFDNVDGQTIQLSGTGWNLAQGKLDTQAVQLAAQRVGGQRSYTLQVSNTAPTDGYSERLNAVLNATGAARGSGSINGLAAGASSQALQVSLDTSRAGRLEGGASVTFSSDGAGTSGLAPLELNTQTLLLKGNVYAPAVAQVHSNTLDFGIVRVGDRVGRSLGVANMAEGPLADRLLAHLSAASGRFSEDGAARLDLAAGNSGEFTVLMDTHSAGVYQGSALLNLASHNDEMSDLSLGVSALNFHCTVNQLAQGGLQASGDGSFSAHGNVYDLDFGSFKQNSTSLLSQLSVLNLVTGQADALKGVWEIGSGSGFTLDGPFRFDGIQAGATLNSLAVRLDGSKAGVFDEVLVLKLFSSNASDPAGRSVDNITLHLQGTVLAVPEPDTYLMLLGGLLLLGRRLRRRA